MTIVPLGDTLQHHMGNRPSGEVALRYPEQLFTWNALEAAASRQARLIQSRGVTIGDFVVVALPNGAPFHITTFALWKLGATPAVVSPNLQPREFDVLVERIRPRLIIGAGPPRNGAPWLSAEEDASCYADSSFAGVVGPHWKAMTSGGSTGLPKVVVDHSPSQWDLEGGTAAFFGMAPGSIVLNPGPLYHAAPFLFSHMALASGIQLIGMNRFDPEEVLRLIEAYRVTWVSFVPAMMHRIWALPDHVRERYDLSSLQALWHVGAPCPRWLKEAWIDWLGPEKIWEVYGGTENIGSTVIRGDEWLLKPGSVGRPARGSELTVRTEDGASCGPGEVGQLWFRAASGATTSHYLGMEADESDGWRSFGDLGYVDSDGYVFIADRRTDLILRGGANIYPAEIEALIEEHPSVAACLIVGLPCDDLGQRVHAIVEPRRNAFVTIAELHEFLRDRLVTYKLPESYEVVEGPLRDEAGKARRSALKDERAAWLKDGREFRIPPRS